MHKYLYIPVSGCCGFMMGATSAAASALAYLTDIVKSVLKSEHCASVCCLLGLAHASEVQSCLNADFLSFHSRHTTPVLFG